MLYELSCLISPDLSEEQAGELIKKLESIVSDGGQVVKTNHAKKIGLAYAIEKRTNAFLFSILFESDVKKMEQLKKAADENVEIIRFLLIKTEIEEDRKPRIMPNTESKTSSDAIPKAIKKTKTDSDEDDEEKDKKKPTTKKKKKDTEKIEMEKIETELNKILDES